MTNLLAFAEAIAATGTLPAPAGAAEIAYVDPRDVGEAAAAALISDGHEGRAYALTGPEAITYAVRSLAGREPRTFGQFAGDHAAPFGARDVLVTGSTT